MASPPPQPPPLLPPVLEQLINKSTAAANLLTLGCFVAFGLLIGFDIWRAFKKRAIWLPGKAFALSGVTVQIIVWWTSLSNIENGYKKEIRVLVWDHYMVVVGRVAVCVFMAYLLPGMAAPSVRAFGALAVTICAQIASELLLLYNPTHGYESGYIRGIYNETCVLKYDSYLGGYRYELDWDCMKQEYSYYATRFVESHKQEVTWSRIADLIILICVVVLGLILCCTVLASKTIQSLLKQRISAIDGKSHFEFSSKNLKSVSTIIEGEQIELSYEKKKSFWNEFEGEVLRSWFVARLCQGDYVISRSVFSSAVWIIVTLCLMVFFTTLVSYHFIWFRLRLTYVLSPLYGFIVIGYVVICWRWLASQFYYPPISSWRRHLYLEDFWTSCTVELINMYDLKRERQKFQRIKSNKSSLNRLESLPTKIFTKFWLHKLLYLVVMLQVCVVFLSKIFGIISELTVGNIVYYCLTFVCMCKKCTMKENQAESDERDESYKSILKFLCMPGERTSALWEANRMSLNETRHLMEKGCKEGISCEEINSIFHQYSLQWEKKGTQLLNDLKEIATPPVLGYFPGVEKHCLKMTVVSLMTILIRVHKAKSASLTKFVKACHEVWDLLSFADECDIDLQANNINLLDDLNEEKDQVLLAADREFYKLQIEYEELPSMNGDCVLDAKEKNEFLRNLSRKCEKILRKENLFQDDNSRDLHDSRNWTKIASSYTLYKLCKYMLDKDKGIVNDIENCVEWTKESLRNVIACSMSRLPNKLVKQCQIWAQEFEEEKLCEAIKLAGKCRGMMEAWGEYTILCCPRDQQPNQREQPLSNIDQCRIDVNKLSSLTNELSSLTNTELISTSSPAKNSAQGHIDLQLSP